MSYKNIIAIALATTTLTSVALAEDHKVNNKQTNWAETQASLNASINKVAGDVELVSTAISNSFSAEVAGESQINNTQHFYQDTSAAADVNLRNITGELSVTTAAIGNSATIKTELNDDDETNVINNSQFAHGADISSDLDFRAVNIDATDMGDEIAVTGLSAAIANSASFETEGNTTINNTQSFRGDAVANMDGVLKNITGDVDLSTVAIGNSASMEIGDADDVTINNNQSTQIDPQAITGLRGANIQGDFTSTTAAMSNSLSVTSLPDTSITLNSTQVNTAYTGATSDISLTNITGDVSATAAAIGNSVSFSNMP